MSTFDHLKHNWLSETNAAIQNIEDILSVIPEADGYERDFHILSTWIATTDINPTVFMPDGYQNAINNPITFSSFLSVVRHAMLDDGDISFVNIKNHGSFIVFAHPRDEHLTYLVDTHLESLNKSLKTAYKMIQNVIQTTNDDNIKNLSMQRLENMPQSIKDLDISYHNHVDLFISEVEDHQTNLLEKHTAIHEKMKLIRKPI